MLNMKLFKTSPHKSQFVAGAADSTSSPLLLATIENSNSKTPNKKIKNKCENYKNKVKLAKFI